MSNGLTLEDIEFVLNYVTNYSKWSNKNIRYMIPKNWFNLAVKDGIINEDNTIFIPNEYIPDDVIYKISNK